MLAIINYIEHIIISFGALGVFLASILEEIIIPIPSTLVQSGAGLFLIGGQGFSFLSVLKLIFWVALPSALGVAIGSLVVYGLVYYGGMFFIKRYGKYFFINYEKVEKVRVTINNYPRLGIALTILRFIPLFPNVFITAVSGLIRVPIKKYLVTTFIGIFVRSFYLGAIGWFAGSLTEGDLFFGSFFGKLGVLALMLVGVSFVTGFIASYIYGKNKN